MKLNRGSWLGIVTGVSAAAALALLAGTSGAPVTASTHRTVATVSRPSSRHIARHGGVAPQIYYPVTGFSEEFQGNTSHFCPAGSGNNPCDGNATAGDYGTIDSVLSGFSNGGYGNYAPATPALYESRMAVVSGDADGNQGAGCPQPGTVEYCTGPYALFGSGAGLGNENIFPHGGFTVTDDLYLSPTTAGPAGSLVDDDVELNASTSGTYGYYGIDNIITACYESGGFVINFGNNSPGSCSGTPVVTSDGWYRFVFDFSDTSGDAYLSESVYSEPSLSLVATSGVQPVGSTPTSVSDWGGPGYFWLPTEDISGLPLANFALQLGQHPTGYTP
jgi:hypothetical protein